MNNLNKLNDVNEKNLPREKLVLYGVESLKDEELIAILLGTGNAEMSVINLSSYILNQFNGLKRFARIKFADLIAIKGVGQAKACRIICTLELAKRISKANAEDTFQATDPESVAEYLMEELRYKEKEYFKIINLDTKNRIISERIISMGSLNETIVHPREVFKEAILDSANGIILAHNHPSGDPAPSEEDIILTRRLAESGDILGIKILDHIVLGNGKFVSLRRENLF